MKLNERESVSYNGDTVTLELRFALPNGHSSPPQTVTVANVTQITLAGPSKRGDPYTLVIDTEHDRKTRTDVLDATAPEEVSELFPRTERDTTVAEEIARGNSVDENGAVTPKTD